MSNNLFNEFHPFSAKAWKQEIQYGLKGKDYTHTLVWDSPEGIKTKPFYTIEDLKKVRLPMSDSKLSWSIAQNIFVSDAEKSNLKALNVLAKGIESLVLILPSEATEIEHLLDNISHEAAEIHFYPQFLSFGHFHKLLALKENLSSTLYYHIDCIGKLARTGNWFFDERKDFEDVQNILNHAVHTKTKILSVDASLYQNAGANIVQQIAYALAHANEYLNRLDPKTIGEVTFKMAIGGNYFFEIAKIRALRHIWKLLTAEYKVSSNCHVLAIPSKRNKTVYAYNTNLLRTSTECMSAILGGADTVCNLPYDTVYRKDNEFSERIARNQLIIFKEESYFEDIENPASGTYYIESLTHQIAEKALALLKDIEAHGGFIKQLQNKTIQRKIKESADKEQLQFDSVAEIKVGTNKYQNPADNMKGGLEIHPFLKMKSRKTSIAPIVEKRLAEKIEKERLTLEGWKSGKQ